MQYAEGVHLARTDESIDEIDALATCSAAGSGSTRCSTTATGGPQELAPGARCTARTRSTAPTGGTGVGGRRA